MKHKRHDLIPFIADFSALLILSLSVGIALMFADQIVLGQAGRFNALITNTKIASDSAGPGMLAVRIYAPPSSAKFRYGSIHGAPVVVLVPGGFEPGKLEAQAGPFIEQGFVAITFLFPGGVQGAFHSDGSYDDRGDNCHRALRDILRFAAGELAAVDGKGLEQIIQGPVRKEAIGILALSNGGSIAATTLGRYGEQIPSLGFLVPWESPTNDQVLAAELGAKEMDPDQGIDADGDGLPANDGPNPAYLGYGFPSCQVDYRRLSFVANYSYQYRGSGPFYQGLFYFDNNGNGRLDTYPSGSLRTDVNQNGKVDPNEDYPVPGLGSRRTDGSIRAYLSVKAAEEAVARRLADPWPSHMATLEETRSYWAIRNANLYFSDLAAKQPRLAGMSVYNMADHVQVATDHPHVHHYQDGFLQNKLWYRLNPDASYVLAIAGSVYPHPVDNDANWNLAPEEMQQAAEPPTHSSALGIQTAALAEMADRCVYGQWEANLSKRIHPTVGSAPTTFISSSTVPSTTLTVTTTTTRPILSSTTTTTLAASSSPARWLTFALNCHDWTDPDQSAETLTFFIDTLEQNHLQGELYVTAPLVEALAQKHPGLIARLKQSNHTISYHVRAPHPALFTPTRQLLDQYSLAQYESCRLDMRTGALDCSRPGGYDYVAKIFGRNPVASGVSSLPPSQFKEYAALLAARGARMMVFEHQTQGRTGWAALPQVRSGLYPRPADYFLARTDSQGHAAVDGDFWWNRISNHQITVDQLVSGFNQDFLEAPANPSQPLFGVVVIHENDFYSKGVSWSSVYYTDAASGNRPLQPPYDISLAGASTQPRTAAQQQSIRDSFTALVKAAAAAPGTRVATSREIARLADGILPPGAFPEKQQEWFLEPGLEEDLPSGYQFTIGSLPDDQNSPAAVFQIGEQAARQGKRGLWIDAGNSGSLVLQTRLDLDKGKEYRFGGWISAKGNGSISFSLVPVAWTRGILKPVQPGAVAQSSVLHGNFDWTEVRADGYIRENFDYCLLRLQITGGGQYRVDDLTVTSMEHTGLAVPEEPKGLVHIGFLIHMEDIFSLQNDTPYYQAKTQVIKDLADLFRRHGALMTIQPELDWVIGSQKVEPGLIRRLRDEYQVGFSIHTHGPKGNNPSEAVVLSYIAERKNALEAAGSGPVTDLNGNFDMPDWSIFAGIGMRTMTAFKNAETQAGYQGHYIHPWRPSLGNPFIDEKVWSRDDPHGDLVYLPGECTQVTKYHYRLMERVLPGLSYALAGADPKQTTTWYFIGHVDSFAPKDGSDLTTYMNSPQYAEDLMYYHRLLEEIIDPLVARGYAVWAKPPQMLGAFESQ